MINDNEKISKDKVVPIRRRYLSRLHDQRDRVKLRSLSFAERHFGTAVIFGLLGFICIIAILTSLFVHGNENIRAVSMDTTLQPGSDEFLLVMKRLLNVPIEYGSVVADYQNGIEFQPRLIEAILGAKQSVTMMSYIWEDGVFSDSVVNALEVAIRNGARVLILEDGFGGKVPEQARERLIAKGASIATYHPISIKYLGNINQRNHRRAFVVDGKVGFIGGMAIADDWLGDGKGKGEWRDSMFEVRTTMARSLQSAFADTWFQTTGEIISGERFYPKLTEGEKINADDPHPFIHVISTPIGDSQPIQQMFLMSLLSAKKSITIVNPYFLPNQLLLDILMQQATQGVSVRLMIAGHETDAPIVRWATQPFYKDLINAGVKIYEYQPSLMHSKWIIVDNDWVLFGSANIDNRSRLINLENMMGTRDVELATRLNNVFLEDMKYSTEITRSVIESYSLFERVRSSISLLFEKQL